MKKAIAYVRVDTDNQVKYGNGFDMQETMIREYCMENGIELLKVFREEGVTGKTKVEHRDAWVQVEDFLADKSNNCKTLVVYNTEHLARINWVIGKIIYEFNEKKWEILSVTQKDVMSKDPAIVLMNQIMAALAEYEGAKIAARMKDGRIRKAASGQHATGRIPYGYDSVIVDGKKKLVVNEEEAKVVRKIFAMRENGYSYIRIAEILNKEGIKPKNWTPEHPTKWYDSTVRKILSNKKYQGIIELSENGEVLVQAENDDLRLL
jgi:site-specific DNA recombinase